MEFTKLTAPTLKDLFVKELESLILSGQLEIGSQLPSERELANQMQVSRAVVNSGIAEMAKKGFLIVKPRSGTFVSDYRRYGTLDTLISIMSYNGGMLRKPEIKSILEVRQITDILALQLVIPKVTDDELSALKDILDQMSQVNSPKQSAELSFNFHHEISVISGNTLLPLIYSSFKYPICSLWERYCRTYGNKILYNNNTEIYHYIKTKNLSGAIDFVNRVMHEAISGSRQIYSE